jgi:hypothetical protein
MYLDESERLTSTPFISLHQIKVDDTDILEDAWGFNSDFCDVISFLGRIDPDPGDKLTARLIATISKQG